MTREDYERRKQRLDEQLRAGIELLESAHRAQVRALDLVWMLQSEEQEQAPSPARTAGTAPAKRKPAGRPEPSRRRSASEVETDVGALFYKLPERFTRGDVCKVIGYEPDRGTLYRVLQDLVRRGYVVIEVEGGGNRATVYRKTDGPDTPASD